MCDVCTLYHDKYKIDNIYMYTYNNVNAHIYILYTYTQKYYALYEKDARCWHVCNNIDAPQWKHDFN